MTIVCECDRRDCFRHLQIPVEQYDRVRGSSAWFVVSAGHGVEAEEVIVEVANDFLVVEQNGAASTASRLDPAGGRRAGPRPADGAA